MKQYFIALALMLTLNASAATGVQPRHRHHAQTEQVVADSTKQQAPAVTTTTDQNAQDEGVEAYSDTTSTATAQKDSIVNLGSSADDWDEDFGDSKFDRFFGALLGGTAGVGAILIALGVILIIILCILAPIILIILLFRLLVKNHNNKVRLAEKAMETGQPIPEEVKPATVQSPDYYWQKGVKNVAIGVGLALLFWFMDAHELVGIGALVACYGAGQIFISKKTGGKE